METYHRKRSKRATISAHNEIMSLKRQEITSVLDGAQAQTSPLARQFLLQRNDEILEEDVQLGSVYEIYHKNLPPRTPVQLRSVRVVMVSEKTDLNVAIRYPSILSLRTYFSHGITEMYPALDEKFVMGVKLAGKVLFRQVPSQEFAEKKHLQNFWLVNPNSQVGPGHAAMKIEEIGLAKELKNNAMVRWGVRRQVMFIGRHKDTSKTTQSSSSFVHGEEELKNEQDVNNGGYEEEEEDEVDEEEKGDEDDDNLNRRLRKTRNLRKRKRVKQANNQLWLVNKKPMNKCKKLGLIKDPTERWSKERYLAAELSLLEAMKEKKAMIGNPITRPALRVEARKRIGDTGLLDHLLKHVANKVAPGGDLRFRRSHNADGAMEYWLESADLLKIRKDAGVSDPFWTPPPGWKPGDSPIQDPIMAKELNHLKEEISCIKREFLSKKQFEEEMANLRRDIMELISKNIKDQDENKLAIVVSEGVDTSPKQLTNFCNSLLPYSESDVDNSRVSREECKKEMLVILKKVEAETSKMTGGSSGTEELINTQTAPTAPSPDDAAKKHTEKKKEAVALPKQGGDPQETSAPPPPPAGEGKAAKIERLKSGFRLCRPQGTFLWPNMVNNPTNTTASCSSQVVDLLVVPTPPSVNSSTPPQLPYNHHHHHPASPPVKPVPERRAVTVTVSTDHPQFSTNNGNKITTSLINLNDIPTIPSAPQQTQPMPTAHVKSESAQQQQQQKRKSSKSSSSASASASGSSSCLSNTVTPAAWLSISGRL
ncbi:protein DYAD [Lactuca sativa]|uniref:protein DYAD n=1 Tax=Lactuca sativa TaxID=4236 RepID=UPI000CD83DFA|nr:protein DYAD [Lactuca sativa]